MAIFLPVHQSLPTEAKQQIFQQHRLGDSAETLALRFCRSCTRIYRIIQEMCAARIMELPLDSMGNEQFARLCSERKERVRQIQRGAMGKLRTAAEEDRIE